MYNQKKNLPTKNKYLFLRVKKARYFTLRGWRGFRGMLRDHIHFNVLGTLLQIFATSVFINDVCSNHHAICFEGNNSQNISFHNKKYVLSS